MKNVSFRRNGVEFEPTKQELKIVLDDYAKQLAEKDKRIKLLDKALEFMADNYWDTHSVIMFCDTGVQVNSSEELLNYFKTQAKKEIENE